MGWLHRLYKISLFSLASIVLIVLYALWQLPSIETLESAELQVPLRIYSRDHQLLAEYGDIRRNPLRIDQVPKPLILALIATEDRRFFEHQGVDLRGLLRAGLVLISTGTKSQGGSTITMQVARNFFLTRHKTFTRKLNEILLALKIEQELSKENILELYLNKVYFGKRAYGVAAAAEVYFGKNVQDLTLSEMALIAGLPQAPSAINPINNMKAAIARRDHVLKSMLSEGFISESTYQKAIASPLTTHYQGRNIDFKAPYVAESVRKSMVDRFGESAFTAGYSVYTTIDSHYQQYANTAVQDALLEFDKAHGYRGPAAHVRLNATPISETLKSYPSYERLQPALIMKVTADEAIAQTSTETVTIPWSHMEWAKKRVNNKREAENPLELLTPGDIVYIQHSSRGTYLGQPPEVGGALIAMDPRDGSVLAMVGGYDYQLTKFNRVTQALRQPGSVFKPFIYLSAFEQGFTPANVINDAPLVIEDPSLEEGFWRPRNDDRKFYGPTRLRVGLSTSKNLVTIRLLQLVGLDNFVALITRFGFSEKRLPRGLSLALGTLTTTPLEIATAYSTLANGGYRVTPYLIHHIEDYQGHIIEEIPHVTVCENCSPDSNPGIQPAERIVAAQDAYLVTHILQDAIQVGTGKLAKSLGRHDLAGKTGSTNSHHDAWFSGYNHRLVATTWLGFDEPRSLQAYASQLALPMWIRFMEKALNGMPESPVPEPSGLVRVKIDPNTGLLASPRQHNAIFELFKAGHLPSQEALPEPSGSRHDADLF